MDLERLYQYIENAYENELVDFKLQFYNKECKFEMIKDVLSFANNCANVDKYIIFGFDNKNKVFRDVKADEIEDISNYIQYLTEYCFPYINIMLKSFEYKSHKLAVLIIQSTNTDRPYMVRKELTKNNKFLLRQGEIYIRKGANNFICTREDLDKIYDSRNQVTLKNQLDRFLKIKINRDLTPKYSFGLSLNIINNTTKNLAINYAEIIVGYEKNKISLNVDYIEEYEPEYKKKLVSIKEKPLYVPKESQINKVVIFDMSDKMRDIINTRFQSNENPQIVVRLVDLDGKTYEFEYELKTLVA